jgi:hypothetical protein
VKLRGSAPRFEALARRQPDRHADVYSQGRSEEVVGQVLNSLELDETRLLVATKVRLRKAPATMTWG